MINFNNPPYVGKELDYMKEAIEANKICGDGKFTRLCNAWLEERTKSVKALLTTSCTHAMDMSAVLITHDLEFIVDRKEGCPRVGLYPGQGRPIYYYI